MELQRHGVPGLPPDFGLSRDEMLVYEETDLVKIANDLTDLDVLLANSGSSGGSPRSAVMFSWLQLSPVLRSTCRPVSSEPRFIQPVVMHPQPSGTGNDRVRKVPRWGYGDAGYLNEVLAPDEASAADRANEVQHPAVGVEVEDMQFARVGRAHRAGRRAGDCRHG